MREADTGINIGSCLQHLMKRIQRGPVRGISLKLQEEERERRLDFVPGVSALDTDNIEVDKDTMEMLKQIGMDRLPNVKLPTVRSMLHITCSVMTIQYSHDFLGYCQSCSRGCPCVVTARPGSTVVQLDIRR